MPDDVFKKLPKFCKIYQSNITNEEEIFLTFKFLLLRLEISRPSFSMWVGTCLSELTKLKTMELDTGSAAFFFTGAGCCCFNVGPFNVELLSPELWFIGGDLYRVYFTK